MANLLKTLNPLQKIMDAQIKIGSKIVIVYFIATLAITVALNIVFPLLSLAFPGLVDALTYMNVSATTCALLGAGAVMNGFNEIRKGVEARGGDFNDQIAKEGTHLAIWNTVACVGIAVFLNIVFPLLRLWNPHVGPALAVLNVSATSIALLGSGPATFIFDEVRKAIERFGASKTAAAVVANVEAPATPPPEQK